MGHGKDGIKVTLKPEPMTEDDWAFLESELGWKRPNWSYSKKDLVQLYVKNALAWCKRRFR